MILPERVFGKPGTTCSEAWDIKYTLYYYYRPPKISIPYSRKNSGVLIWRSRPNYQY